MWKFIKTEFSIFLVSMMFFTRIPMPKLKHYSDKYMHNALKYFPLVGYIVSGIACVVYIVSNTLLPHHLSVLFTMIAIILTTGAFHEDSFADFCDGFGGGYSKEKILAIMKDSTNGTYGIVGLLMLLGVKFMLLNEISSAYILQAVFTGTVFSRISSVVLANFSVYVSKTETAKSKKISSQIKAKQLIFSIITGIIPLFLINWKMIPFIILIQFLIIIYFRHYIHKKIGGYTGDVLGCLQQLSEIAFYLSFLIFNQCI